MRLARCTQLTAPALAGSALGALVAIAALLVSPLALALPDAVPAPGPTTSAPGPGVPALPAIATLPAAPAAARAAITEALQRAFHVAPESIVSTAVAGMYEVFIDGRLLYVNASGTYLLEGPLVSLDSLTNLTVARLDVLTGQRVDVGTLPTKDAIKVVRGNGSHVLYAFEDANCGFCKRLEADNLPRTDLTVYIFPLAFLGDDSARKARAAWCSKDPATAWQQLMAGGPAVMLPDAAATCDTSFLARNMALAAALHVTGTPTLFAHSGARIRGYVAADVMDKVLVD